MATNPQIINAYPAPDSKGIAIGDVVKITFDQEMDLDSINSGTFVLTGPDEAPVFGPIDVTPLDERELEDEDILSSPYFPGYIKGTITFSKVDASGSPILDDVLDITGDGALWYTIATFTPDKPLKPNVEYTCFVLGDESSTDEVDSGVKSRSVFDTVFTGTGTGVLKFYGTFTGTTPKSYTLEITTAGETGDAEYLWWDDLDPLTVYEGVTTTGSRELEDGLYVVCEPDGSFVVGDKFQVITVPFVTMISNYQWSFSTGGGSIITPPSNYSASGIDYNTALEPLRIVSIIPAKNATNLDISDCGVIFIKFNKILDSDSINDSLVSVWSEPINGIFNGNPIQYTGNLAKILNVSGDTLTILLQPGV